ncbi:MAG TPA: A24 family peptidase C-terminal domain-containing protein [Methanomassiliicoccales archaeon]|nr:A24 family peptidase C-terminal domain-containing protein [Methanomassiliicoccales archaeon]
MDWMPILKIAVAFTVLLLASWSDWRIRMASDVFWIVLGTLGLIFLAFQIYEDGVSPLYYLFLFPLAVFFYDIFWDRPSLFDKEGDEIALGLFISAFIVLGTLLMIFQADEYLWKMMSILFVFLIIILLYVFDILKGGADAKALISLAILFPVYPAFMDFPLIQIPSELVQHFFPFVILVLFNAALFLMVFPISFAFYNAIKGDSKFPLMFFGYKMSVDDAKSKFVWTMERVEEGERKTFLFPKGDYEHEEILDELEAVGADRIWVTPKIPFLIPLTISLIFSAFVGNIFFYFFP